MKEEDEKVANKNRSKLRFQCEMKQQRKRQISSNLHSAEQKKSKLAEKRESRVNETNENGEHEK